LYLGVVAEETRAHDGERDPVACVAEEELGGELLGVAVEELAVVGSQCLEIGNEAIEELVVVPASAGKQIVVA
jgi:hypothetical protein